MLLAGSELTLLSPCSYDVHHLCNFCLKLQTARSLIKGLAGAREGKESEGNAAYLQSAWSELSRRSAVAGAEDWRQPQALIDALRYALAHVVFWNGAGTQKK